MRIVEVVEYDPCWPSQFEKESVILTSIFGTELVHLHHIGSTSVPGLAAKPIIDIIPEVRSIAAVDGLNARMISNGYTPMGEYGIAGRRYFFKGNADNHSVHLHVFEKGHPEIARHILFRDYLRAHPDKAREYGDLKRSLACSFHFDIDKYMDGKDAFIRQIDVKAKQWTLDNN